jgi:1-deoxy-D-xylulose 5-phosphate reductoisomerase
MIHAIIEYTKSAFKHRISEADIRHALLHSVYDEIQDSDGDNHLLLGFDRSMNLLEIAYKMIDERTFKVFHAMKCRNSYYELLRR